MTIVRSSAKALTDESWEPQLTIELYDNVHAYESFLESEEKLLST